MTAVKMNQDNAAASTRQSEALSIGRTQADGLRSMFGNGGPVVYCAVAAT